MSLATLPIDVIHEILLYMPDFATLFTAIRISNPFYEAFQAHHKSILRTITEAVTGPAVAPAIRLALYKQRFESQGEARVQDLPAEDHYLSKDWTVTRGLTIRLVQAAKAIRILRDFYSLRNKDRTSLSKLEPEESLRFDQAMYRYWLYFEMLERGAFWRDDDDEDKVEDDGDDDDENIDDDEREFKSTQAGFTSFLFPLSSSELLDVLNIGVFAEKTAEWEIKALPSPRTGTVYALLADTMDPAALAENLVQGQLVAGQQYDTWEPVRGIIRDILLSRSISPEVLEEKTKTAILTTVIGAEDKCSRCQVVKGVELLGTPNASLLSGMLPVRERLALLPGLLHRCQAETSRLSDYLININNHIIEKDLFHEMVDIAHEGEGEHEDWSKDDWYCLDCVRELFRQRLMLWWRSTKVKIGDPVQDDCWYGYNCRTMVHRPAHATKLNHLCTPSRGDPPGQAHPQTHPPMVLQGPNNPN